MMKFTFLCIMPVVAIINISREVCSINNNNFRKTRNITNYIKLQYQSNNRGKGKNQNFQSM